MQVKKRLIHILFALYFVPQNKPHNNTVRQLAPGRNIQHFLKVFELTLTYQSQSFSQAHICTSCKGEYCCSHFNWNFLLVKTTNPGLSCRKTDSLCINTRTLLFTAYIYHIQKTCIHPYNLQF